MVLVRSYNQGTIWMLNWEGIGRGIVAVALASLIGAASASAMPPMDKNFYLPNAAASKIVSVAKGGSDRPDGASRRQRDRAERDRREIRRGLCILADLHRDSPRSADDAHVLEPAIRRRARL